MSAHRPKRRRSTPLSYLQETSSSGVYWPKPVMKGTGDTAKTPTKTSPPNKSSESAASYGKRNPTPMSRKKTKPKTSKKKSSKKVESRGRPKTPRKKSKKAPTKNSKKKSAPKFVAKAKTGGVPAQKVLFSVTSIADSGHFLEYRSELCAKDDESYWASQQNQTHSWICFQFELPAKVTEVGIRDRNDQMSPKVIKVEFSESMEIMESPDNGPWNTVLEHGDLSQASCEQSSDVKWLKLKPSKVPVRFAKVHFLENFGSMVHYVVKQVLFRS